MNISISMNTVNSMNDVMDTYGSIRAQIAYEDERLIVGADYLTRCEAMEAEWEVVRSTSEYRAHYDYLVSIHGWERGMANWCLVETDREFIGSCDNLRSNLYSECQQDFEQRVSTFGEVS